ncbi:hypothetical protein MGYG_04300 [Nannizzia gypsea CBS 118893]|uniref:Uncharacterized protein n=1 Tax=Arthroderma gypseum (strain ATCC MYA-4604 / CBS 118893) TaxID=535722 RepID=E4US91_ARTGP|nr:hypothetical protein MGYG_04300 [Nannizzia gypsea CBS 118893]EFR01295.1 hypothetical protein MGYG_04300 [Nannizzia gypsea CBS 118893]
MALRQNNPGATHISMSTACTGPSKLGEMHPKPQKALQTLRGYGHLRILMEDYKTPNGITPLAVGLYAFTCGCETIRRRNAK